MAKIQNIVTHGNRKLLRVHFCEIVCARTKIQIFPKTPERLSANLVYSIPGSSKQRRREKKFDFMLTFNGMRACACTVPPRARTFPQIRNQIPPSRCIPQPALHPLYSTCTVYRPFDPSPFPLYFPSTGIDFLSNLIFLLSSFYSSSALFSNLLSNLPQSSSAFLIFSLSLF